MITSVRLRAASTVPGSGKSSGDSGAVERQMREIVAAEAVRQPLAADLGVGEVVDLARQALRLGFGAGDHRAEPGQDQHLLRVAALFRRQRFKSA